jgi:hypothetical protein
MTRQNDGNNPSTVMPVATRPDSALCSFSLFACSSYTSEDNVRTSRAPTGGASQPALGATLGGRPRPGNMGQVEALNGSSVSRPCN